MRSSAIESILRSTVSDRLDCSDDDDDDGDEEEKGWQAALFRSRLFGDVAPEVETAGCTTRGSVISLSQKETR